MKNIASINTYAQQSSFLLSASSCRVKSFIFLDIKPKDKLTFSPSVGVVLFDYAMQLFRKKNNRKNVSCLDKTPNSIKTTQN